MSIEAMKQALEAWDAYDGGTLDHPMSDAMEALRVAIEQAEKQEPVAWMWSDGTTTSDPDRADGAWTPLYTAPRQWVGLTEEEIKTFYDKYATYQEYDAWESGWFEFAGALEAKLKEKNSG